MIFLIIAWILRLYIVLLWGRFILEWVQVLRPDFKPKSILLVLCETVYTLTDPPVKLSRKLIPPVRVGAVRLDVALMVVLFVVWALIQVFYQLAYSF